MVGGEEGLDPGFGCQMSRHGGSGPECYGLGTSRKRKRQESGARSQKIGRKQKAGKAGIDDGDWQTSLGLVFSTDHGPAMPGPRQRAR